MYFYILHVIFAISIISEVIIRIDEKVRVRVESFEFEFELEFRCEFRVRTKKFEMS